MRTKKKTPQEDISPLAEALFACRRGRLATSEFLLRRTLAETPGLTEQVEQRVAEIERAWSQRTAKYTRYNQSEKGRARTARYEATPKARARKLLYEHTIRAARRAPKPDWVFKIKPDWDGWFGRPDSTYEVAHKDMLLPNDGDMFDVRARYAETVRRERAQGLLSPMVFARLGVSA